MEGRYKEEVQDFCVEELPAYVPSGDGDHLYLWLEKENISTMEAVKRLAQALGRRDRDFGYAGLKDARAVTRQWVSIEHVDPEVLAKLDIPDLRLLEITRHGNKLKVGHLRGNRFKILLRGAKQEDAVHLQANLEHFALHGVPNYFGEQRFGKRGANLDKGLKILQSGKPKKAAFTMPQRLFQLMISAVQSEVFNRVLAARIQDYDQCRLGDVAYLHDSGACFLVEDLEQEQARCQAFEISPTGPMPGPKMLCATGEMGELEAAVLKELDLSLDFFGSVPKKSHQGARRSLRQRVLQPQVEQTADGVSLSFTLDAGAYATSLLRELLLTSPWFAG